MFCKYLDDAQQLRYTAHLLQLYDFLLGVDFNILPAKQY